MCEAVLARTVCCDPFGPSRQQRYTQRNSGTASLRARAAALRRGLVRLTEQQWMAALKGYECE